MGAHSAHHSVGGVGNVFICFPDIGFHFSQDGTGYSGCQRFLVWKVVIEAALGDTRALHNFVDGYGIDRLFEQQITTRPQ
jgi:hypothetical protein